MGKTVSKDIVDKIFELGKRRGYFWPSYEIYGGVGGFYDMGPYGAELKNNIISLWRKHFITRYQELNVEIETPVIAPEKVFKASGHVESFTDPIIECTSCKRLFRADHLIEEAIGLRLEGTTPEQLTKIIRENNIKCPVCGGELGDVRTFNLLFKTQIGPYSGSVGYIRPEAAQGMFVSFKRVYQALRNRLPIGIAQIGRVGRNEISPRQGMIRLREFTIMEFEFFFNPKEPRHESYLSSIEDKKIKLLTAENRRKGSEKPEEYTIREAVETNTIVNPWLAFWMYESQEFIKKLGIPYEYQFFEEKLPEERAHYSSQTFDQMVKTARWGWVEVSGHAYRGDYDLSRHMEYSGEDLTVFVQFEKPIVKKIKKLAINKAVLGRVLREKTGDVLAKLKEKEESIIKSISEGEDIIIDGIKLPREAFSVVEKEEKITGEKIIPHVVEPSFGSERLVYITLEYAYREKDERTVLSIPRELAPIKVAVFPLVDNRELVELSLSIRDKLVNRGYRVLYDRSGSIGRRYARADEIGVPVAITVDFQTLEDNTVTLRDRDSWKQVRVDSGDIARVIDEFIYMGKTLEELKVNII